MIERIEEITLYVKDQDVSKEFWTKKIGFIVKEEHPLGPNMKWVEVGPANDESTNIVLYDINKMSIKNKVIDFSHPSLLFKAVKIEETYAKFKERGIKVGEFLELPTGRMFTFKDPDGNSYIVREDNKGVMLH